VRSDKTTTAASGDASDPTFADESMGIEDTQINPSTADVTPEAATLDITTEAPDRYQLPGGKEVELGVGGLGRVVVRTDTHLGRQVALKEMRPGKDAPALRKRFVQEARIAGYLEHPSIVPVYELGQRSDGTVYYTMKRVEGRTLQAMLEDAESLEARLALLPHFVQVAQAVAYAHSRQVIHRDIKPANIMVGAFGETVLLDWGIAKFRDTPDLSSSTLRGRLIEIQESANRTLEGEVYGTPLYMSPEQAQGAIGSLDERSDVWSLGAILFQILTGRPPFTASSVAELLVRISRDEAPAAKSIEPAAPADLAAVAAKALSKRRVDRYPTAEGLAEDVSAFIRGRPVAAYTYSTWELFTRLVKRNVPLTLVVLALLVSIIGGSLVSYGAYREAERSRVLAAESEAKARQSEAKTTRLLARSYADRARDLVLERRYGAAALYAATAAEVSSEFQSTEADFGLWHDIRTAAYAADVARRLFLQTSFVDPEQAGAAGDPSTRYVRFFGEDDRLLSVIDGRAEVRFGDDFSESKNIPFPAADRFAFFEATLSSDERHLVIGTKERLHVVDLLGASSIESFDVPGDSPRGILMEDGKSLLVHHRAPNWRISKIDRDSGRIQPARTGPLGWSFEKTSRGVLATDAEGTAILRFDVRPRRIQPLRLRQLANQTPIMMLALSDDARDIGIITEDRYVYREWPSLTRRWERPVEIQVLDAVRDGGSFVVSAEANGLALRDRATGHIVEAIDAPPVASIDFARHRAILAAAPRVGGAQIWALRSPKAQTFDLAEPSRIALAPSGIFLWSDEHGSLHLVDAMSGSPITDLRPRGIQDPRLALMPSGRRAVLLDAEHRLFRWDLEGDEPRLELVHDLQSRYPFIHAGVAISNDGRWAVTSTPESSDLMIFDLDRRAVDRRQPTGIESDAVVVGRLTFNPSATLIVAQERDGELVIVNRTDDRIVFRRDFGFGGLASPRFFPSGDFLAVVGEAGLVVLDGQSFEEVGAIPVDGSVSGFDVSADGRWLVIRTDGPSLAAIRVWDLENGRWHQHLPGSGSGSVQFDAAGRRLMLSGASSVSVLPWPPEPVARETKARVERMKQQTPFRIGE